MPLDDNFREALSYLSTPTGSFWKWVDEGKVVAWSHGATVAFREEIGAVLERLAPRGLPCFDSVLVLLAATRHYWEEDSGALRVQLQGRSHAVMAVLDRIHDLPMDLIQSVEAKAALAEIVFESVQPVLKGDAARCACEILTHGIVRDQNQIPHLPNLKGGRSQTASSLTRDLQQLERGLSVVTEESLRLRLKTGLDQAPVPADVVIPAEPAAVRTLLQSLAYDEELGGMCRVARSLSAVLLLPRPIEDSDELPLGGVSDISNRGTLDRLLLSELAHEDLMLATRVALNEALYLRRETPPGPPPHRRYVLVDAGLRMWGVPRVYAAASLLSLAATAPGGSSILAYRASGTDIKPIDLLSREGLIQHLAALESHLDASLALPKFFQKVLDDDQPAEVIIVTSDTAAADPDFQRILNDAQHGKCYLATVNREGDLQVLSRGLRGTKSIISLTIDLNELFKTKSPHQVSLVNDKLDPNLPAIFHASRFPFRLPAPLHTNPKTNALWSVPLESKSSGRTYGVMIPMRDRRLMFYDEAQRGAIQISTQIPFGPCLWSGSSGDLHLNMALIYRSADPAFHLLVIHTTLKHLVATRQLRSKYLARAGRGSRVTAATCYGGIIYVIYESYIEAFDLNSGELIHGEERDQRLKWLRGRFFLDCLASAYDGYRMLTCTGTEFRFEPIRLQGAQRTGTLLTLFDRTGVDGPFGVHLRGSIANLSDQTEWHWTNNPRSGPTVLDIDHAGDRVLIEQNSDSGIAQLSRRIVHLDSRRVEEVWSHIQSLSEWDFKHSHKSCNMMHRFSRIHIEHDGTMSLISSSKSRAPWQLKIVGKDLRFCQTTQYLESSNQRCVATFEPTRHPDPGGSLSVATWQDGSRVFVDSRGLLHLQSADRAIPESSVTLKDGEIAVWTNNGQTYGSRFFLDESNMTADQFMHQILKPFIARLS